MKIAFPPISDPQSKILILGTMPGEKSIEVQQYYGHPQNQFWKLLFTIFDKPFSRNYEEREALLRTNHIALWDVLSHCEGEGSADTSIRNEIANDFDTFYTLHPEIKHVFFASKQAEKFYIKYAIKREGIVYHLLPSPSPANAAKSFEQKLEEWKQIRLFA